MSIDDSSDEEDDDVLFATQPMMCRKKTDSSITTTDQIIAEALAESDQRAASRVRMNKARYQAENTSIEKDYNYALRFSKIQQEEKNSWCQRQKRRATATIEGGAGAGRRRGSTKVADRVEGLFNLDDGDGEDEDDALGRQRRKDLVEAYRKRTVCYGARQIILFDSTRSTASTAIAFYLSANDAKDDLLSILDHLEKDEGRALGTVASSIRTALDEECLDTYLEHISLHHIHIMHDIPCQHDDLCLWLLSVAFSADLDDSSDELRMLAHGAFDTINALHQHHKTTYLSKLENLCASLDHWLPHGRAPSLTSNEENSTKTMARFNQSGLINLLRIWEDCIPSCQILTHQTAANCLAKLCRIGIDEKIVSNSQYSDLRSLTSRVASAILDRVVNKFSSQEDSWSDQMGWMKSTAATILRNLGNLPTTKNESDDEKDPKGWLCQALIIENVPMFSSGTYDVAESSCTFKNVVAMNALQYCIGCDSIDGKIERLLREADNDVFEGSVIYSKGWMSVAAACAALAEANDQDAPRFLSTVQCSFAAVHAGLILANANGLGEEHLFKSKGDALAAKRLLRLLDEHVQSLLRKCGKRMHPFYANAKSILVDGHTLLNPLIKRAGVLADDDEDDLPLVNKAKQQQRVTSYFDVAKRGCHA